MRLDHYRDRGENESRPEDFARAYWGAWWEEMDKRNRRMNRKMAIVIPILIGIVLFILWTTGAFDYIFSYGYYGY